MLERFLPTREAITQSRMLRWLVADWSFGSQDDHLQKMVDEARGKGAQVVVVLSHNGMDVDLKMASRVRGIDAIFGGHTHDGVPLAIPVANGGSTAGGKTLVTNAGSNGKFLGVLDCVVREGRLANWRYRLLPVFADVLAPDAEMAALIASNEEMANMVQATRELARKINAGVAPMVEASLIEKAPQQAAPVETKPARPMISLKQATIQEANDAAMERRCRLTRWGEEFGQQYVNQRGVYAHPGTADGEEKLLAALRREHPDKEIDLKEAKEYGAAAVVVDKVPH